jgi:hypothetical protein
MKALSGRILNLDGALPQNGGEYERKL